MFQLTDKKKKKVKSEFTVVTEIWARESITNRHLCIVHHRLHTRLLHHCNLQIVRKTGMILCSKQKNAPLEVVLKLFNRPVRASVRGKKDWVRYSSQILLSIVFYTLKPLWPHPSSWQWIGEIGHEALYTQWALWRSTDILSFLAQRCWR